MGGLSFSELPLQGMFRIETPATGDKRGRFKRIFCQTALAHLRAGLTFTQVNLSDTSQRGTIRGLHYQLAPAAEAKMIRCLRGRVFDVAVDLRAGSPTFLRWHAIELDADSDHQVFIPEGVAHGFQTLTDDVQLLYFHTANWRPDLERRLRYDDPRIGIEWPLPPSCVSDKDAQAPLLDGSFAGAGS